jgi:hypothetical protein
MSLYSEMIAESSLRGSILWAYDFTQYDEYDETVPQAATGNLIFPAINAGGVISSFGLLMDGTQTSETTGPGPEVASTFIWIGVPTAGSASIITQAGYNHNGNYFLRLSLDSNLVPLFANPYRNESISGTIPLEEGELSVIVIRSGPDSKLQYGKVGGSQTVVEGEIRGKETLQASGSSINGFWNHQDYIGEAGVSIGFRDYLPNSVIDNIVSKFKAIGQITLPTNLSAERTQGISIVREDGKVEASVFLAESETEFSAYLTSNVGTFFKFFAFDSTPTLDVFKTEFLDPQAITEIDFFMGGTTQTQNSKVSGIVQIDGNPAQRSVRAFGYNPTAHAIDGELVNLSKSLGNATSDSETGEYTIDLLAGYGKEIFVVAFDDYGDAFTAEQALAVGDRIHPTTPNGHVWETTGAGTLPVEEPTWIVDTETSQLYGTASMIARPFYRPMVHGPITPEVVEAP